LKENVHDALLTLVGLMEFEIKSEELYVDFFGVVNPECILPGNMLLLLLLVKNRMWILAATRHACPHASYS